MSSLVEISPVVLKKILNFVNVFSLYCYYLLLEKDVPSNLNKREFLSPKDGLCQVWLNLVQWFLRNLVNEFSLFCYYPP